MKHSRPVPGIFRLAPIAAALALSGCSIFSSEPTPTPSNLPLLPKRVYAEPLAKGATPVKSDVGTIVFLRPGTAAATPATNDKEEPLNVYINGRFLASLLPGGYAEHEHCAGPVEVAAVFDDARIRYLGQRGHSQVMTLEAGKTVYLRLDAAGTGADRSAKLVTVPADSVWLAQYHRQAHAISRAPSCGPLTASAASAAVVPAAAPVSPAVKPAVVAPVAAAAPKSIDEPLERWRAAWERGDFTAYSNSYAGDFKGDLASHSAWEKQRRARLDNQAKKITLENVAVSEEGDTLVTRFVQNYQSKPYHDRGGKLLKWKRVDGDWKIVQESFDPSADLSAAVVAPAVPASGASPAKAAAPAGGGDDAVRAALERWHTAWEHGDFATYADSYARNFTGDQGSHSGWEKLRRERVQGKSPKITLENVEIGRDGDAMVTRFTQVYRADQHQDRGEKSLRWKMIRGEWRIVSETFQ